MTTYRFRLRFNIAHKGILQGEDSEYKFILPNGHNSRLVTHGGGKISNETCFVLISDGYKDAGSAHKHGSIVKDSLLCYAVKNRIGMDLGKDIASTILSDYVKQKIFQEQGIRIMDDVHGISVCQEDYPTSCICIKGLGLVNPCDTDYFTTELNHIADISRIVTAQVKLAMELLTFSFFEKPERSRFLTLVLAVEALLQPEQRPENVQLLVKSLIEQTKNSDVSDDDKKSIIGSLKWLYKDSISKSLNKMANHLLDSAYGGKSASKFISKCYAASSELVHNGEVNGKKHNIHFLVANLELYVTNMVTKLAGI